MGLSFYNIKKWTKMMLGTSILHVNQGVGKMYSKREIKGYYNDLTEKVLKDKDYGEVKIPLVKTEQGHEIMFPIAIFQYGLGAYDLYLSESKELYLEKFKLCANWALENQNSNGSWECFYYIYPENPYSSMCQGEGASLLVRAYQESGNKVYLYAAKRAIEFMLISIEDGGTTYYTKNEIFLKEYTHKPVVLNGWIFSIFGLYDYLLVKSDNKIEKLYILTIKTLVDNLHRFDNGYWSKYDCESMLASPFYHNLHIAQLKTLYDLTNENIFEDYACKWQSYENRFVNRQRAFFAKAYQKITE